MNPSRENPETIRSDIDATRRRMDDTMDALGDRLQPKHLLDEVFGYFRSPTSNGEDRLTQMREKIGHSASNAMHSVVDTVKQNPVPALLIGAGVAWMIYANTRSSTPPAPDGSFYGYDRNGDPVRYDPDRHYDRPLQYPSGYTSNEFGLEDGSKMGDMKSSLADKASAAGEHLKDGLSHMGDVARENLSHMGDVAREKAGALRTRAGEITARATAGTREAYTRTRERVVTTADRHPLEVGLVALAAGLLAGLALPTPNVINRSVGPTADRLRDRTREAGKEMLEKGRHVADAAVTALKEEAQAQGITADTLREKVAAIGNKTKESVQNEARNEGLLHEQNKPVGSQLA